jgi:hypothetical protein
MQVGKITIKQTSDDMINIITSEMANILTIEDEVSMYIEDTTETETLYVLFNNEKIEQLVSMFDRYGLLIDFKYTNPMKENINVRTLYELNTFEHIVTKTSTFEYNLN